MSSFKYIKCMDKIKKVFNSCITKKQLDTDKIWCNRYNRVCTVWKIKEIIGIQEEYFIVDNYI